MREIKFIETDFFLGGWTRIPARITKTQPTIKCDCPKEFKSLQVTEISAEQDEYCRKLITPVLDTIRWGIGDYESECFDRHGDIPERSLIMEILKYGHLWRVRLATIDECWQTNDRLKYDRLPSNQYSLQVRQKGELIGNVYLI